MSFCGVLLPTHELTPRGLAVDASTLDWAENVGILTARHKQIRQTRF
jgi:hypothetical protein